MRSTGNRVAPGMCPAVSYSSAVRTSRTLTSSRASRRTASSASTFRYTAALCRIAASYLRGGTRASPGGRSRPPLKPPVARRRCAAPRSLIGWSRLLLWGAKLDLADDGAGGEEAHEAPVFHHEETPVRAGQAGQRLRHRVA